MEIQKLPSKLNSENKHIFLYLRISRKPRESSTFCNVQLI